MEQPSTQITSESPVEASSESSQPKSGSLKTPTIIAAIASVVAIAGIAAGVYFFIDSNNKSTEISTLNSKIEDISKENPNGQLSSQETTNVQQAPTLEEVTKLLSEKYNISPIQSTFGDTPVNSFDNFDEQVKIVQTIHLADSVIDQEKKYPSDEAMYIRTVGYSDFNNAYKEYFSEEDLAKQDYEFKSMGIIKMSYLPEEDKFEIYYRDGLGGYSFVDRLVKVMGTTATENGFRATVISATIDTAVKQDASHPVSKVGFGNGEEYYYILMSNENLEAIYDSISTYEFNFVGTDNQYKLISIQKK